MSTRNSHPLPQLPLLSPAPPTLEISPCFAVASFLPAEAPSRFSFHQRLCPPSLHLDIYFLTPCSVMPSARASSTLARLWAYSAEIRLSLARATDPCAWTTSIVSVTPAE